MNARMFHFELWGAQEAKYAALYERGAWHGPRLRGHAVTLSPRSHCGRAGDRRVVPARLRVPLVLLDGSDDLLGQANGGQSVFAADRGRFAGSHGSQE